MNRGLNRLRTPNPMHYHIDDSGGSTPLPEFDGAAQITSSEVGGTTGLWNLTLLLQDSGGSPLTSSAIVNLSFKDVTNGITVATASYNYGDVIGTDAPLSESNWTTAVVPFLTGTTIEDSAVIGFTLFDYLIDEDDLDDNLIREYEFCLTVQDNSQPSVEDCASVDYSFYTVQYTHEKTGVHSHTWALQGIDYGIIMWGDGTGEGKYFHVAGTISNHTYPDATEKTVRMFLPTGKKTTRVVISAQRMTSITDFDTSALTDLQLRFNLDLSSIPDFDTSALITLNLEGNAFTTVNSSFDVSSVVTLKLNNNDLTSVPSGWDVSSVTDLRLNDNQLTSLPSGWNVAAVTNMRLQNNNLTALPSGWNIGSVTTLMVNGNNLSAMPEWDYADVTILDLRNNASLSDFAPTTLPTAIVDLKIDNCSFTAIPDLDYSSCQVFTSLNNSISIVESSHNFSSLVQMKIISESIATWDQTAIATSCTELNLNGNSLSQSEVDDILAQLKASYDSLNRAISGNLENNTTPSAAGLADKAYLNGNGCTILTD